MSNVLKVVDLVLKESQRIAHEKLAFIGTVDRQYDKSFAYNSNRGPNGQTLRIREPNQYTRRQGSRVMDVQDQSERTQNLTVATQDGVDMRFNSAELVQSVNSGAAFDDLSKNYIEPAMAVLCSGIEGDFLAYATKATYNVAGTYGTPATTLAPMGAARAKLNQGLAPKDGNRCVQMNSVTMGGLVNGLSGLFHDRTTLEESFKEGFVTKTSMATYYENDRMWTLSNGADVVGAIDQAAFTEGATTFTVDGLTAAPVVGSVFTIADVYATHPETKDSFSHLQQFVVTADTTPTITAISFSPAIYYASSGTNAALQNVSAIPVDSAALTWGGSTSTSYAQNLMYHKEAYQFVTADLPILDDAHKCQSMVKDNLSLRCWMASDIRNDELLMRIDILYGMGALRPAWATRITD